MSKAEGKMLYRIIGQKAGVTITAETKNDLTFEEAKGIATNEVLGKIEELQPFVVLPITTQERWHNHSINFCPRCGANLKDDDLENSDFFNCFECNSSVEVHIHHFENEEEN